MDKQRCLVLDIETAPMLAYVWGRHDQNIALNQILGDWRVISWAAKWLGTPTNKIMQMDTEFRKERAILGQLWELIDAADIVIGQNSKAFDMKKLNARFIIHGMQPPSPYKHLDTYLIAKNSFAFTANSLEYLTETLCKKYKKLKHAKYPGMTLWHQCELGNSDAWKEMRKYNIHDVLATEELYEKLKAWAPKNAPSVFAVGCGVCGGTMSKNGVRAGVQLFRCRSCGRATSVKLKKSADDARKAV
jgi:DNA polymerase elongation subunit (family B)